LTNFIAGAKKKYLQTMQRISLIGIRWESGECWI